MMRNLDCLMNSGYVFTDEAHTHAHIILYTWHVHPHMHTHTHAHPTTHAHTHARTHARTHTHIYLEFLDTDALHLARASGEDHASTLVPPQSVSTSPIGYLR